MKTLRVWHHEIGIPCAQNVGTVLSSIANQVQHNWGDFCVKQHHAHVIALREREFSF